MESLYLPNTPFIPNEKISKSDRNHQTCKTDLEYKQLGNLISERVQTELDDPNWEFVKDQGKIKVFKKEVKGLPNISFFKATADFEADWKQVWDLHSRVERASEMDPRFFSNEIVERFDDRRTFVRRTKQKLHPMLSDRDWIFLVNQKVNEGSASSDPYGLTATTSIERRDCPKDSKFTRGHCYLSGGRISPNEDADNSTHLEILSLANPGGWIPKWLSNSAIQANFFVEMLQRQQKMFHSQSE